MTNEAKASWIFGSLFGIFLLAVFIFGPPSLPGYKQQILAYICATLAGFFAIFFTGTLLLNAQLPIPGKWTVRGGAAFALFLVVLFWWRSDASPIPRNDPNPSSGGSKQAGPGSGTSSGSTNSSSGVTGSSSTMGGTGPETLNAVVSILPLVKGGAPVGTTFQSTYTRNDGSLECHGEYVKVSATVWHEQPSTGSPADCLADAANVRYTERHSDDPHYILLYDENRSLFARFSNTEVGHSTATAWRLTSNQTWNASPPVTRVK
jgi:hypothetical protein